jgi:hypothetical protein
MNLNNPVIKGAIMLLLTSILSLTTNFPETSTAWYVFGFSVAGTLAIYFAQSQFFPASSMQGQVNGLDLLKGVLISAGSALSTWVSTAVEGTVINWKSLIITMIGLFCGYLIKQWQTVSPQEK